MEFSFIILIYILYLLLHESELEFRMILVMSIATDSVTLAGAHMSRKCSLRFSHIVF